jgi:hypothetical protein
MRSCDGRQGEQLSVLHILNLCDWIEGCFILFSAVSTGISVAKCWSHLVCDGYTVKNNFFCVILYILE